MDRNETYPGSSIQSIRLKLTWAQLEIAQATDGDVRLMIAGDDESVSELRIEHDGGYLRVAQPQLKYAREFLPRQRWLQIGLMLPAGWAGAVDADTIAGPVIARGVKVTELAISTVSAAMNVRGIEARTATLHTVAGRISGTDIQAASLNLRTVSGDMLATGTQVEQAKLSTVSGDVQLELRPGARQLDIQSISGAACVRVEETVRAQLHSLSGQLSIDGDVQQADINLDQPMKSLEISASSVTGDLAIKRGPAE